jgi:hypothetical protein
MHRQSALLNAAQATAAMRRRRARPASRRVRSRRAESRAGLPGRTRARRRAAPAPARPERASARPPRPPSRRQEPGVRVWPASRSRFIFGAGTARRAHARPRGMRACGCAAAAQLPPRRDTSLALRLRASRRLAPRRPSLLLAPRAGCIISVPDAAAALEKSFFEARTPGVVLGHASSHKALFLRSCRLLRSRHRFL